MGLHHSTDACRIFLQLRRGCGPRLEGREALGIVLEVKGPVLMLHRQETKRVYLVGRSQTQKVPYGELLTEEAEAKAQ